MQQLVAKPSLLIFVVIYVLLMVVVGAYYTKKSNVAPCLKKPLIKIHH